MQARERNTKEIRLEKKKNHKVRMRRTDVLRDSVQPPLALQASNTRQQLNIEQYSINSPSSSPPIPTTVEKYKSQYLRNNLVRIALLNLCK